MDKLKNGSKRPDLYGVWEVNSAASKLGSQASTIGARHISDGTLRLQFTREVTYYANSIVQDVENGRKTPAQGLKALKDEDDSLISQAWEWAQQKAKLTPMALGVLAGSAQISAGGGICYASLGVLCATFGVPLIAHGANNVYENGRNLIEGRSDTEGPVREFYRGVAKAVGRSESEADIAYGVAELGMSAYGVSRLVLKPDSWRLFRYVREDYVRTYEKMSWTAIATESASNIVTLDGVSEKIKDRQ